MLLRLAVMTYEAVLLFGLVFVTGYALLALAGWTYPLSPAQRWLLQAVLFVAIGAYFVYCWVRAGQTLAMKSWRLRVVDRDGRLCRPSARCCATCWRGACSPRGCCSSRWPTPPAGGTCWHWPQPAADAVARRGSIPGRQLLHDRLLGSRVIRD
jgi:uncharacterized RDD family membrane protein YckC